MANGESIYVSVTEETIDVSVTEETIDVSVTEEIIQTQIVEETIDVTVVDEIIQTQIVEETIDVTVVDEIIQAEITEEVIDVYVEAFCNPSSGGSSGQIFVTDVTNSGSGIVGNKLYVPNTVPVNKVVTEATTDDNTCTIHFLVEGGLMYSPIVTLNGVDCNNLQEVPNDQRLFTGSFNVIVDETTTFVLHSSTGTSTSVIINKAANGPEILTVKFVNGYPGTQTEVKENDNFEIEIEFDSSGTEPTEVEIFDFGACKHKIVDLQNSGFNWGTNNKAIVSVDIDYTGIVPILLPCRVRSKNEFGTYGNTVDSNETGNIDGANLVLCCDLTPSFIDNGTSYPIGQLAIKDGEECYQDTVINNFSSAVYTSVTNELIIENFNVYEQSKKCTCVSNATYNDSINNFKITAYREENDTYAVFGKNIEIANVAPIVYVIQPIERLRSSQAGISYQIRANCNQHILGSSNFDVNIPVSGTWEGFWTGTTKNKTRNILITDSDINGEGDWEFVEPKPTNRAGIPAVIMGTEIVGGFIKRTLTIDAWPNRQVNIGKQVSDVTKLVCENLSKGGNAVNGGTIFEYKSSVDNEENKFTILNFDTWYNCDQANAVSNTSGTAQIILEETV